MNSQMEYRVWGMNGEFIEFANCIEGVGWTARGRCRVWWRLKGGQYRQGVQRGGHHYVLAKRVGDPYVVWAGVIF